MKNLILTVLALVIISGAWLLIRKPSSTTPLVDTTTNTGNTATTSNETTVDPNALSEASIVVDVPTINATTTSPIKVSGKAKGNWFFEASAPVQVLDSTGKTIGQGTIQATGDWMTTDYVPFTGSIAYTLPSGTSTVGTLVFMNDNPSGDPARSISVRIPINFKR